MATSRPLFLSYFLLHLYLSLYNNTDHMASNNILLYLLVKQEDKDRATNWHGPRVNKFFWHMLSLTHAYYYTLFYLGPSALLLLLASATDSK